jgi:hypothetical protein
MANEIVVAGSISSNIGTDKYIIFPYTTDNTGTGQTQYTFNVPTGGILCDILMVGGGGAGGKDLGGGGGGGAVLYGTNITITSGSYNIKVGNGAIPGDVRGKSTEGFGATILGGGSAANTGWEPANIGNGNSGGSGGGGKSVQSLITLPVGGSVGVSTIGALLSASTLYNGNSGGNGSQHIEGVGGGGGGGATEVGGFVIPGPVYSVKRGGKGGDGISIDITGTTLWWGAGGGGGANYFSGGDGGKGGGGAGGGSGYAGTSGSVGTNGYGTASGKNAGNGTGSGGGGAEYTDLVGGKGGSGIVIIRYRSVPNIITSSLASASIELIRGLPEDTNTDYKIGNYEGNFKIMSSTSNVDTNRLLLTSNGDMTINGSILPAINSNYNLGSFANKWKDLYLSGNSIFLDNTVISSDTSSNLNIKDTLGVYKNVNINNLQLNSSGRQIIFGVDTAGRLTYTASNITSYAISTSSNLILTVDKGGTGVGTLESGQLLIGNGTSNVYQNTNLMWDNTTGNLGIGTSVPVNKLHICEVNTSNTKLTIQNNYLPIPNEIVVAGTTSSTIGTTERYISFPFTIDNTGTGQTQYTFTSTENLVCDILLVGGGGGGGTGGGGAGGYVYNTNISMNAGSYTVRVGNGSSQGNQGINSTISSSSINMVAYGGGAGGLTFTNAPSHTTGQVGSYGGNGTDMTSRQTFTSLQGNRGGSSIKTTPFGSGGGGGGADEIGGDSEYVTGVTAGSGIQYNKGGKGGNGKLNSITGTSIYYAGGGTGGTSTDSGTDTSIQIAPLGGGGLGSRAPEENGGEGTNGLGGGGGGSDWNKQGGRGGSGIVIIRYRFLATLSSSEISALSSASIELVRGLPADTNTDYKIGNYEGDFKIMSSTSNVDISRLHIDTRGNVGVGTSVPDNKFHICDTITSDTRLTIQNNYVINSTPTIPNEIVVAGTTSGTVGSLDRYIIFPYTTDSAGLTGQTQYTFSPTEALNCDILIVGGGGGGGQQNSGGGGAGGLVLIQNLQVSGNYTINVGKGGNGGSGGIGNGSNGYNSTFIKSDNSVIITANGGGGGGGGATISYLATNGGSGGGGGWYSSNAIQTQKSQSQIGIIYPAIFNQFGEDGGHGGGGGTSYPGGGGGGAGSAGATSGSNTTGQNGGQGINKVGTFIFSDKFTSNIGDNGWFSGGGGSGGDITNSGFGDGGSNLYGGGGDGNIITTNNVNYVINTTSQTISASTILQVSTNISRWYAYTGAEITNVIISTDNWNQEQPGIQATTHSFTWNNTTNLLTGYSTADAGHFGCWGINLNNQVSYTLNSVTYNKHYLLVRNINQIELTTIAYKARSPSSSRDIGWLPNHFKIFGTNFDKTDITLADISANSWVQLAEIKLKSNNHTLSFHKSGVFNIISSAYTSTDVNTFFDTYNWTDTTQTFNTFLFMIINIGSADSVMNMDELAFRGIATTTTSTTRGRGINGINGTGGGGAGIIGTSATPGGSGGSGLVIVKYRKATASSASIELIRGTPSDSNTDYKIGNYNGDFKIMSSTSNVDTNRLLLTSNGDMTLSGSINAPTYLLSGRNILDDTSNYVLSTSNLISKRITDLTTDMINENVNASKKFIVNNRYNNNLELNGTLTINSNLIVLGESTRLDTIVYTTERLEVVNVNNTTTAFMVQQNSADQDIFVASNMSTAVFKIANNGDVNINGVGVYKKNNRDIILDTCNYILTTSNNLILKANENERNASNYILTTSNNLILKANENERNASNYILTTSNNLISKVKENDNNASNYILTTSNNLILKANENERNASNYILITSNNLIFKANENERNASNYILTTSNNLIQNANINDINISTKITLLCNTLLAVGTLNDGNASNYILTASNNLINKVIENDNNSSNYILTASNNLINKVRENDDNSSNYILTTSNNLIRKVKENDENSSNYILTASNNIIKKVRENDENSSNYILTASDILSTRITNLTTDMINENATKKFIVNNSYNNSLEVNGNLTINSNLIVLGDSTRLDTIVYTTERLEVVNANNTTTALMVQQNSADRDIFVASNMSMAIFKIANNGDVIINGDGNYKKNNRDVLQDTSNYILSTSNYLVNYNNLINKPDTTFIATNDTNVSNYVSSVNMSLTTSIGTKQNIINSTANQIIIGNGNGLTTTNSGLTFVTDTLTATNISGAGANITALNMTNVSSGTLAVTRGGTGATAIAAGQILIGNTTSILQTSNLIWDTTNTRLGIGTETPAVRLHVFGGDIACTGDVSAYYSDERLKTKISDINDPLEIVDRLNGFYYIPNDLAYLNGITNTDKEIGLSAQDVQKVLPEIVRIAPFDLTRDADDKKISKSGENYLTISYERLAPVFVEAIKELKKEITFLKQRVEFLENR